MSLLEILHALVMVIFIITAVYLPAFVIMSIIMTKKSIVARRINNQPLLTVFIIIPIITVNSMILMLFLSSGNLSLFGISFIDFQEFIILAGTGMVIAAVVLFTAELVFKLAGVQTGPEIAQEDSKTKFILATALIILPSIGEELVFRGLIQTWLDSRIFHHDYPLAPVITPGVLVGAVLFGFIHLGLSGQKKGIEVAVTVVSALLIGTCAGLLYSSSGSIIPAIILHMESNMIGIIIDLYNHRK